MRPRGVENNLKVKKKKSMRRLQNHDYFTAVVSKMLSMMVDQWWKGDMDWEQQPPRPPNWSTMTKKQKGKWKQQLAGKRR